MPGISGGARLREEARRGDQVPRRQGVTVGDRDPPHVVFFVPAGALDGRVEPDVATHVVLVRDVVGVLLDLGPGGEQPVPVRVGLEEIRIRGGGGDVDGQPGIVVDVPGAAQIVLAIQNGEVVESEALELDRRADSSETGAHDDRVVLRWHGNRIPYLTRQ